MRIHKLSISEQLVKFSLGHSSRDQLLLHVNANNREFNLVTCNTYASRDVTRHIECKVAQLAAVLTAGDSMDSGGSSWRLEAIQGEKCEVIPR